MTDIRTRSSDQAVPPRFNADFRAQFETLLRWRRDVRRFRPDPVAPDLLEHLFALAHLAPSVGLSQPWRIVTVDDRDRRATVRACFESCNSEALAAQSAERRGDYARLKLAGLDEAPCQFAVFVDPEPVEGHGLGRLTMPETLAYSAVMAVHGLWLAARTHGLGLGWVSILDPVTIRSALDVPAGWQLIGYFCLGFPETDSDTPELDRLGWEARRPLQRLHR